MDPDGGRGFTLHVPIPGWPTSDGLREMTNAINHHPLVRWFAASGDLSPTTLGRVPRRLHTPLTRGMIRDYLSPVGIDQQLSIPYSFGRSHYRAFVLARSDRDFTDQELQTALQLQPLLQLLDRQYRALRGCTNVDAPGGLTCRELAVLRLLADGLTASSIGGRLALSPRTVHRHLDHVYRKLGVTDRVRAVLIASEAGLLEPGDPAAESAAHPRAARPNRTGATVFSVAHPMPAE